MCVRVYVVCVSWLTESRFRARHARGDRASNEIRDGVPLPRGRIKRSARRIKSSPRARDYSAAVTVVAKIHALRFNLLVITARGIFEARSERGASRSKERASVRTRGEIKYRSWGSMVTGSFSAAYAPCRHPHTRTVPSTHTGAHVRTTGAPVTHDKHSSHYLLTTRRIRFYGDRVARNVRIEIFYPGFYIYSGRAPLLIDLAGQTGSRRPSFSKGWRKQRRYNRS